MTATVRQLRPAPSPTEQRIHAAAPGALATSDGRLYVRGGPGWICVAGSPYGPDYASWLEHLAPNAVLIREGL